MLSVLNEWRPAGRPDIIAVDRRRHVVYALEQVIGTRMTKLLAIGQRVICRGVFSCDYDAACRAAAEMLWQQKVEFTDPVASNVAEERRWQNN